MASIILFESDLSLVDQIYIDNFMLFITINATYVLGMFYMLRDTHIAYYPKEVFKKAPRIIAIGASLAALSEAAKLVDKLIGFANGEQ